MSPVHGTARERRKSFSSATVPDAQLGPADLCAGDFSAPLPWYVVHTKFGQEQAACENLARQGFAVYFPRIKVLRRFRGRQQARFEPLFSRYIFLQPGSSVHSVAPVRSTFGVAALVRFGQDLAVMRPETLKTIHDFETRQNEASDEAISPFQPGERVNVADGPLTGIDGVISDISQHRVIVLMHLLGRDTRVSVTRDQLLLAN